MRTGDNSERGVASRSVTVSPEPIRREALHRCSQVGQLSMEPLWSPVVVTGGNGSQVGLADKGPRQAKRAAAGCDRLPLRAHGKQGVDGSSPPEGLKKRRTPALSRSGRHAPCRARWAWSRLWSFRARDAWISEGGAATRTRRRSSSVNAARAAPTFSALGSKGVHGRGACGCERGEAALSAGDVEDALAVE